MKVPEQDKWQIIRPNPYCWRSLCCFLAYKINFILKFDIKIVSYSCSVAWTGNPPAHPPISLQPYPLYHTLGVRLTILRCFAGRYKRNLFQD